MDWRIAGLAAAIALASAGTAAACAVAGPPMNLLHATVPPPEAPDIVVLGVTMDRFEGHPMAHVVTRARVHAVVRGYLVRENTQIRVEFDTACSEVAGSGRSGYLVGRVTMTPTGMVFRPRLAPLSPRRR
jgi:hypothetical protein